MLLNPKLYEINTRVWIKQFGKNATLKDIPTSYFKDLANKGIDLIWLMGIWKTCPDIVDLYCFSNDLTTSYSKALPGWIKDDVVGSPYSIDVYEIHPYIGTTDELISLRNELHELGMKLILDFVPNHFGAGTKYLTSNPEIFLQTDEESYFKDSFTFFKAENKIFAHGRDPLFPAWTDTVQINLFSDTARKFLTDRLLDISNLCDGVRCDMAMLPMNNVFHNTWIGINNKNNVLKPAEEFWKYSITKVREKKEDFIFIAEVYWGLEWELQQLGFSYTYDKRMMDRLHSNDIVGIKAHLMAEKSFQEKSVRFIENHDEPRSVSVFGKARAMAAATVITTIMGMKLYYDGQFSGKRVKLPVQLCREPEERFSGTIYNFYNRLLSVTNHEVFKKGTWQILEPAQTDNNNFSSLNMLAWQWKTEEHLAVIIINLSEMTSQCRLQFDPYCLSDEIVLFDALNNAKYKRSVKEIKSAGLFVELRSYSSHIFLINISQ